MDLIILRGIPGCGKTSFAEVLGGKVASADDFLINDKGEYEWSFDRCKMAHSLCIELATLLMKDKTPKVIISNTNTRTKDVEFWTNMGKQYGYRVFSVIIENRHGGKDNHAVPESTLIKMKDQLSNSVVLG